MAFFIIYEKVGGAMKSDASGDRNIVVALDSELTRLGLAFKEVPERFDAAVHSWNPVTLSVEVKSLPAKTADQLTREALIASDPTKATVADLFLAVQQILKSK